MGIAANLNFVAGKHDILREGVPEGIGICRNKRRGPRKTWCRWDPRPARVVHLVG